MKIETGDKSFPILLIGDSNPARWEEILTVPFDLRHPVVHNIWTSILDSVQDTLYRKKKLRLNTRKIYIRNAVQSSLDKPEDTALDWENLSALKHVINLRELLFANHPFLVLAFGRFSFELVRRSLGEAYRKCEEWNTKESGNEFRNRHKVIAPHKINLLPLLHISISRGNFIQSHNYFCGLEGDNYFHYVGTKLSETLLPYSDSLDVWVEE